MTVLLTEQTLSKSERRFETLKFREQKLCVSFASRRLCVRLFIFEFHFIRRV